jgi:hypothetical protein
MHSQVCGDFSQALSVGGEESAEQSAGLQFLDPGVPRFGACAETIEEVHYDPEPLAAPAAGNLLICCSRPREDVVIDI